MTADRSRLSIEALRQFAELRGFRVHEAGPHDFEPDELMLDLDGYGETVEAYFRRHPSTGYWRFHHGFIHGGITGDRIHTLKALKDTLRSVATTAVD